MNELFNPNSVLSYQEPYILAIMVGYAIMAMIVVGFAIFSKDPDSLNNQH